MKKVIYYHLGEQRFVLKISLRRIVKFVSEDSPIRKYFDEQKYIKIHIFSRQIFETLLEFVFLNGRNCNIIPNYDIYGNWKTNQRVLLLGISLIRNIKKQHTPMIFWATVNLQCIY